ncbi:hypothetical protein EMM73_19745 [Rheinheimera sediminis]|uniref:hypothetical protein n=1 Tax=Rheinheimera sp. YQF-1 TaxID=2499626 RepID=UPI000FDC73CF|nr:hypothetical protein [Rheinheimera sp. YQF-1]RVT40088.1 hypothetical protein EMM73_19745 [Rheinheimera sp. YQF-1]
MTLKNTNRNITFRGAGEHDVTEVTIDSGEHLVNPGDLTSRVTYTVSYKGTGALTVPELDQELADAVAEAVKLKVSEIQGR